MQQNRIKSLQYKINFVDIFRHLSTIHERDWQADKQTDHGTVTSTPIGEIACFQRCCLIMIDKFICVQTTHVIDVKSQW